MPGVTEAWSSGDSYEAYVGRWSRQLAPRFLEWAKVPRDGDALDVGCGTGALSQALLDRGAKSVTGVDLSAPYVEHARRAVRPTTGTATTRFEVGDATVLPFPTGSFDVAVSGLVLNFVPTPLAMAREMRRVLRPRGVAAVYVWDYSGRMEMMRHFWDAAIALDPARAVSLDEGRRFPVCSPDRLTALFREAGFHDVAAGHIDVPTAFRDFDDFWTPFLLGQGPAPGYCKDLPEAERSRLRDEVRRRLPVAPDGTIHLIARAFAVRGLA